jgi:MoaA/NifB/PqqE/SkfB family radical SAM enzyme
MNVNLTIENGVKKFRSENYNYNFRLSDGFFQRWGKTLEDDPKWSPFSPEICDIEISASGKNGGGCPIACSFCYKNNNNKPGVPDNMSLATFKTILSKFPKFNGHYFLCQVAFGITSIGSHPEIFDIFQHCRDNQIIPNVTINGSDPLTDEQINNLVRLCGAMAISVVPPREENGYNLIRRILDRGGKQINIHYVIHNKSIAEAYKVCDAIKNDLRLKGLNAIVFLGLKPKNRGQSFDVLPTSAYIKLVEYCFDNNIPFGFDSCSSPKTELAVTNSTKLTEELKKNILNCCERCESTCFSFYLNQEGKYTPCSFGEDKDMSIDFLNTNDFLQDVWNSSTTTNWRKKLFSLNRECPIYPEIRIHSTKE